LPEIIQARKRGYSDSDEEEERRQNIKSIINDKYHSVVIYFGNEEV